MNVKQLLYFLAGLAMGSGLTWYLMKENYIQENKEAVKAVKDYYKKINEEKNDEKDEQLNVTVEVENDPYETVKSLYSAKEQMFQDYTTFTDEDEDEPEEEDFPDEELYPSEPVSAPYVISEDQFVQEKRAYDKANLYFFETDKVVTDENYDPIPDYESLVGKDLGAKFKIIDRHDEKIEYIYIRNDSIGCDYEIKILHEAFDE